MRVFVYERLIYYKELAHKIMETEKSQGLQSESDTQESQCFVSSPKEGKD